MLSRFKSRATNRRRSSSTELSFHGINTSGQMPESVTHVSGTKRHLCLGSLSGAPQGLGAPDPLAGRAHCLPQVSAPLHVEPEVGAVSEHPRENEGCRSSDLAAGVATIVHMLAQIGRASCRERVCPYV